MGVEPTILNTSFSLIPISKSVAGTSVIVMPFALEPVTFNCEYSPVYPLLVAEILIESPINSILLGILNSAYVTPFISYVRKSCIFSIPSINE